MGWNQRNIEFIAKKVHFKSDEVSDYAICKKRVSGMRTITRKFRNEEGYLETKTQTHRLSFHSSISNLERFSNDIKVHEKGIAGRCTNCAKKLGLSYGRTIYGFGDHGQHQVVGHDIIEPDGTTRGGARDPREYKPMN